MLLPPVPDTPETRPGSGQSTLAKQETNTQNEQNQQATKVGTVSYTIRVESNTQLLERHFFKLWGKVGRPTVVDSCSRVKQHILISPSFSQWQEVHSQLILVISPSVRTRVPHWSPSRYKWDSSFTPPSYLHILISYLHPTRQLHVTYIHNIKTDTSGKLSREKTFEVLWLFAKVFLCKILGCGIFWRHKWAICESFLCENFPPICPQKFSTIRYTGCMHIC